jgi:hypothetical protein
MTRLVLLGALAVAVASAHVATIARANHMGNVHQVEPQGFTVDAHLCSGTSSGMVTGNESAALMPLGCASDILTPAAAAGNVTAFLLPFGNRLATRTTYHGYNVVGAGSIADGTQVGTVKARMNLVCDTNADYAVDSTSTMPITDMQDAGIVGEQLLKVSTGFGGSEFYLGDVVPPFATHVRYRANVNHFALAESFPLMLSRPYSYHVVVQTLPWPSSVSAMTRYFDQGAQVPDTITPVCLDGADSWEEQISSSYWSNPAVPGLYAVWTTQLSEPGLQDEQVQEFSYTTSCKQIGGAVADTDNDCLSDAADGNDVDRDQDNDGLLDGVEAAWAGASCVTDADCDNDGRTDAEEMVGPPMLLTNPLSSDTDSDGLLDAGLNLDCDGDGDPDYMFEDRNQGAGTGRNRVTLGVAACKPDGTSTNLSLCVLPQGTTGCGGSPFGNVGAGSADNCPNRANAPQTNAANTFVDLDALPVPGDSNGRFIGSADVTHPDGRFTGDFCDPDDDNDGILDSLESDSVWWDASASCNTGAVGSLIALNYLNRDTDGDGSIDGVECELQRNPASAASVPGGALNATQQTYYRLTNLAQPGGTLLVTLDDEDVIAGVPEVRGGLAGSVRDSDRDGCADAVELADVDGNRSANDADRLAIIRAATLLTPFTTALTAEEKRTGDLDFNNVVSLADYLIASRTILSGTLSTAIDMNTNCTATRNGFAAN